MYAHIVIQLRLAVRLKQTASVLSRSRILAKGENANPAQKITLHRVKRAALITFQLIRQQINGCASLVKHPAGSRQSQIALVVQGKAACPGVGHPVHRLDRGTSGLLVVAKHPHAQEQLKHQLHTGAFQRTYLAVCEGTMDPPEGRIELPLGPKPGSLIEQMVRPDGKPAATRYETLRTWDAFSLLRLELETGRTHQIRVHMASLGHPLLGDLLYGAQKGPFRLQGQALHAKVLGFRHPSTGEYLEVDAPLPEYFLRLISQV